MTLTPREIPKLSSDLLWAALYPKGSYIRLKGKVVSREKEWFGFKEVECGPIIPSIPSSPFYRICSRKDLPHMLSSGRGVQV